MITVKTGVYSVEEIQLLASMLANARYDLALDCSGDLSRKNIDLHCIKCKYKHVCEDLAMTSAYLETLADIRSKKEEE